MRVRRNTTPGANRPGRTLWIFLPLLLVGVVTCCIVGLGGGLLIGGLTEGLSLRGERNAVGGVVTRAETRSPAVWRYAPTPTKTIREAVATPTPPLQLFDRQTAEELTNPPQSEPRSDTGTEASAEESAASSATTAPLMGLPADQPRIPATRLVIPKLGVDTPVMLIALRDGTWQVDRLTYEVGHLQGTASPGDPSNIAIAGHVTLAQGGDGPFRYLSQLRQGDEVLVFAGERSYRYMVKEMRVVSPEDVQVTFPTAEPTLTLITCANWNRERRVYDDRVIAVARLVQ
ncbi:MAG: sortase [Anaerolineae bacterium]